MRDPQAVDFQAMVDEIHRYFVHVLQDKLGGIDDGQSQMAHGSGHVVIRFNLDGETLVFRVPKFGLGQMRGTMLAYRHLAHLGVMPEKVYHDAKCIIERFIPGVPLDAVVSAAVLADLARKLAAIHAIPASGYGPLSFDRQGSFQDARADYLGEGFADGTGLGDLPAAQQAQLRDAMHRAAEVPAGLVEAPMVLGHGDLWRKNVLVSAEDFKVIDWDRVGAYPRERELALNSRRRFCLPTVCQLGAIGSTGLRCARYSVTQACLALRSWQRSTQRTGSELGSPQGCGEALVGSALGKTELLTQLFLHEGQVGPLLDGDAVGAALCN
jgi:hypothetical protein